jgi:parvulin-like peptidyl-prolyl isomerase
MGAYRKSEWPELHAVLAEPLFALKVNELAAKPVEADYGYVVLRRCKVERARSRHILVRYKGASRAGPEVKRDREQALARAQELRQKLSEGADFAALARQASDDSSGARGGDLGSQARGRLALAYEQALFALAPGEISQPVESEFGFHIIERTPD